MLVDAAPVTAILRPPLVVSAVRATAQLGVLSSTVVVELTSTVVPAEPSLRIRPSILKAADAVPAEACWRATMVPRNEKALLLGKIIWLVVDADKAGLSVNIALGVASVVDWRRTQMPS